MQIRALKWLGLFILIVAAIAALARFSKLPIALPEDSVSAKLLQSGFYEVGAHHINESDTSRTTPLAPERRYIGKLWFPMIEEGLVAPGQHPLLIYVHRFGTNHREFSNTAELLASKGYLVLAFNMPVRQSTDTVIAGLNDTPEQAKDISFLLDLLTTWNESPETLFYRRINLERIGVIGMSMGSVTALTSAFHKELNDKRIALAAVVAPFTQIFTSAFFDDNPQLPLLAIAANGDRLATYAENAIPLLNKHHNTWLVTLENGSHAGFSESGKLLRWLKSPDALNCVQLKSSLKTTSTADWFATLGDKTQGVSPYYEQTSCEPATDNALNPIEQLRLTQIALTAFIDMHFADTEFERTAASDFLTTTMAAENTSVRFTAPLGH